MKPIKRVNIEKVSRRFLRDFSKPLPLGVKIELSVNKPFVTQSSGKKNTFVRLVQQL